MIEDYDRTKELTKIIYSEIDSIRFDKIISKLIIAKDFDNDLELTNSIKELVNKSDFIFINSASKKIDIQKIFREISVEYVLIPNLIYWKRTGTLEKSVASFFDFKRVRLDNLNEYEEIIEDTFKSYPSHYSFNPSLRSIEMSEIYREWGRNVLDSENEKGFIISDGEDVLGMISFKECDDLIEVLLAGVVQRSQKKGNYVKMMEQFISKMCGGKEVYISTHIGNLNVQKCWKRLGFEPIFVIERFHCWKSK